MRGLAIIGGSGFSRLSGIRIQRQRSVSTRWGNPSAPIVFATLFDHEILFLARHGEPHTILPHQINYQANIWALKELGAMNIIAINTVGGITVEMTPRRLVIPDQIIDYTSGRAASFFTANANPTAHIDFSWPYSTSLRKKLIDAAGTVKLVTKAVYGVTQGPRLETAAEIARMEKDGCDIVGMTAMPEAVLARELGMKLACCALVVNRAAGKSKVPLTAEIINGHLAAGSSNAIKLIENLINSSD